MINCINSILYEKQLLSLFKDKFIQKLEYGSEYFEGDKNTMIREIFKFIDKMMKEEEEAGKVKEAAGKVKETAGKVKEVAGKVKDAVGKVKEEAGKVKKEAGKVKEAAGKVKEEKKDDKKICPKCNHTFKYPSMLKTHFKTSYHCLLNEKEINLFFNPTLIINENKCNKCNKDFKQKCSLFRHQRNINCNETQTIIK